MQPGGERAGQSIVFLPVVDGAVCHDYFFAPNEIYLNFDCVTPTDEEIGLDSFRKIHDDNIYCEI